MQKIITLILTLTMSVAVWADQQDDQQPKLYLEDIRVNDNHGVRLKVNVKTDRPLTGAEFSLRLHEKITASYVSPYEFAKYGDLNYAYAGSDNFFSPFIQEFRVAKDGHGCYMLLNSAATDEGENMILETDPSLIPVMDDALLEVRLSFDNDIEPGYYPVTITDMVLTDLEGNAYKVPEQTINICYMVPIQPSGINQAMTDQKEGNSYDIQGRKINGEPQSNTILIENNRKQLIRK